MRSWIQRFWKSSIGAKLTMAVTGLLLFGFVVGHLSGNLLVFQGPDGINAYAEWLREHPGLLWSSRAGLLLVLILHVVTAIRLTRDNRAARPVPYAVRRSLVSSPAARSMMLTGVLLTAYVVFHMLHLTWGVVLNDHHGRVDAAGRMDVFFMVTEGFKVWWIVVPYLVSMGILGLHLMHGISSFFQTLGLNHERLNATLRWLGPAVAAVIVLGYVSIPVAVIAGVLGEGGS